MPTPVDAYLHLIKIQGFPIYSSTQRWEPIHQGLRSTIRNSNKANISSDMTSRAHLVSPTTPEGSDDFIVEKAHPKGQTCLQKFLIKDPSVIWAKLKTESNFLQNVTHHPNNLVDVTFGKKISKILGFLSKSSIYCFETCTPVNRPKTLFKAKLLQDREAVYCLRRSFTYRIYKETTIYHYVLISSLDEVPHSDPTTYTINPNSTWTKLDGKISSILHGAITFDKDGQTWVHKWDKEEHAVLFPRAE